MNDAFKPAWNPLSESALVPYQALTVLPVRSILVLAPHPDDEVFACGGLLALAARQGIDCRVVVVSDGGKGGDPAVREVECNDAAKVLGYRRDEAALQFWRLPDREVAPDASLVAKIRSALRIQAPDWLLAPSPFEVHPDHVAVCRAAMEAAAGNSVKLGFFEVGQPLLPNLFVDITSVADDKRRAMDCFVSQLANQRYDCQISALNQYRAYTLGPAVTHAEALWFAPPAQCHDAAGVLDAVRAEVARRLGFGMGSS